MTDLPKAYLPAEVEPDLYQDWVSAGLFHANPDDDGEPFSIVIPPPNVTGSLHVGHALDNTIQDAIIRRERMRGKNAVWIPGTDHAGIATQNVVEKQLAKEGTDRHAIGREAFLNRVWAFKEESGGTILRQLRQLGASCDWEREAFTFDETRSRAVREVFVSLYEQGLIYRGNRLINWCPRCQTALSDIEVEHEDLTGELVSFRYPFADDSDAGIVVATTRAETMLGDTAIAVNPTDERYAHLVGRMVRHPFIDREFAIIADDYVDPEFGSGAVKITPAHDPNDYEMGLRHDLPMIEIFDEAAHVLASLGTPFSDLDRFAARKAVIERLTAEGLLVDAKPHDHAVGHCSRCRTVVEPRLSLQWFVAMRDLAKRAADAVRQGQVVFVPEARQKPFLEWLDNLHDWCISRQIWWGHRIPAWYGPDGEIRVSREDITDPSWQQDDDVLDTWFSSQLWPFAAFGWEGPEKTTPEFETWYPTATLVTGYDINTFWVSRMLMIGLWFTGEVPFRTVHNHGLVRDEHGKKMSKSFGNVIDPLDLIASYGADATRYALVRSAAPGTDVPLAEEWVEGAKRFANKVYNAVRFAMGNLDGHQPGSLPEPAERELCHRYILSRMAHVHAEVDRAYDAYDWPRAAQGLYHFIWDELADWYLEAVKPLFASDDPGVVLRARQVLSVVLDDTLRLLHPLMPFVTEMLWRSLTGSQGGRASLMVSDWPTPRQADRDETAENEFAVVQDFVTEMNRFRSQNAIAPAKRFTVSVTSTQPDVFARNTSLMASLAGLSDIVVVDALTDRAATSRVVFASGTAQVDLTGLIDLAAEKARIGKERDRVTQERERINGKLANESFVARAPAAVVDGERARLEELNNTISQLDAQYTQLDQVTS